MLIDEQASIGVVTIWSREGRSIPTPPTTPQLSQGARSVCVSNNIAIYFLFILIFDATLVKSVNRPGSFSNSRSINIWFSSTHIMKEMQKNGFSCRADMVVVGRIVRFLPIRHLSSA